MIGAAAAAQHVDLRRGVDEVAVLPAAFDPITGGESGHSFRSRLSPKSLQHAQFEEMRMGPHCVRDDNFSGICAVRRSTNRCHPERSEGPLNQMR